MKISFIQPSRNNLKYLKWSYEAIRKNQGDHTVQICVADDASTEEYKEAFEGLYDKIFVVDPQGGGGEPIAEARKKKKKKKSKKRRKSSRSKYFGRFFYPMASGFYGDYSSAGSAGIADGGGDGGGGGE